jgi:hypothetical protein
MSTWELRRMESSSTVREPSLASDLQSSHSSTADLVKSNTHSDSSSGDHVRPRGHLTSTPTQPRPPRTFHSYVQRIFKALGLSAGFNLLAKVFGWPVHEEKKAVMKKDRLMATLRCIVHLVPASGAIALLVLNGSNHYIGGELSGSAGQDSQKLGALLFAAKLHELFMLASLGAIVITYIRKELAFGEGVPFGTIFSAGQFKDLTFLWSPELWGSIYQQWQKKQTKWFTIYLLVVCSIIGLTVGPSTGILMRPRLEEWPAGGTTFWINATENLLHPKVMEASAALDHCAVDNGDLSCPAAGWQVFNEQYFPRWKSLGGMGAIPQELYMSGRTSLRRFILRTRNVQSRSSELLWANAFTMASVSPAIIADALVDLERSWINAAANSDIGNFKYRRDVSFTTEASQPLVLTRCSATQYRSNNTIKLLFPSFRNVTLRYGPGTATSLGNSATFGNSPQFSDRNTTSAIEGLLAAGQPSLYWIDDADILQDTAASMTVVATIPPQFGRATYYTCSIDSRFANVTLKTLRSSITQVFGDPIGYDDFGTFNPTYQPVRLSADWAQYLNPTVSNMARGNATVFSTLASTAGIWKSTQTTDFVWYPMIVENILATLVANGIARANYNRTIVGTMIGVDDPSDPWSLGDWVHQILPRNGILGYGGHAFNISSADKTLATQFELKARILGYAYSPAGKTQVAAMIVLSIYVLLVLCHIGYSATTGWYSSGWGSPSELTALAMNSNPTDKLRNTGGGIETIQVFKEQVTVRVRDDRLQMIFRGDGVGSALEPGRVYA